MRATGPVQVHLQTVIVALLVLINSTYASCAFTDPKLAASSLSQAGRPSASVSNATISANDASRVQYLTLPHRPPQWGDNMSASRPAAASRNPVSVNFTIYYPARPATKQQQQHQQKLPLLFLMNGANVEARQYSTLASLLNERGYVFVGSDYYQPLPKAFQGAAYTTDRARNWTMPSSCPADKILAPSAALLQTFLDYMNPQNHQLPHPALQNLQSRGVVLVSHSYGGAVSFDILSQRCSSSSTDSAAARSMSYCEGYQPSLRTGDRCTSSDASSSGSGSSGSGSSRGGSSSSSGSGSGSDSSRGGSSSSSSSRGGSSSISDGLIRGVVVFEGYRAVAAPAAAAANHTAALRQGNSTFLPAGESIPNGMFVLFLSSEHSAAKMQYAYQLTNVSSCSCAGMASFAGLNHFGINDYQKSNTSQGIRQLTPCGRAGSSDPLDFRVSENHQNQQLRRMARLIDEFIRGQLFGDKGVQKQLQQMAAAAVGSGSGNSSSSSEKAVTLQLKPQCFR